MSKLIEIHTNHAVSMLGMHLVWCTKYRKQVLDDTVELVVRNTIGQACTEYGWRCIALEVMPDHVHLFVQYPHTETPMNVARTLKSLTAVAVFNTFPTLKGRKFWGSGLWSRGTYYGSVGQVSQDTVTKYIQQQKTKEAASAHGTSPRVSAEEIL